VVPGCYHRQRRCQAERGSWRVRASLAVGDDGGIRVGESGSREVLRRDLVETLALPGEGHEIADEFGPVPVLPEKGVGLDTTRGDLCNGRNRIAQPGEGSGRSEEGRRGAGNGSSGGT